MYLPVSVQKTNTELNNKSINIDTHDSQQSITRKRIIIIIAIIISKEIKKKWH